MPFQFSKLVRVLPKRPLSTALPLLFLLYTHNGATAAFQPAEQFNNSGNWSRVSIDGDRAVVGAQSPNSNGYAHFFKLVNGSWQRDGTVRGRSPGNLADLFGFDTVINGDRAVIGAPGYPIADHSGAVYIFDRQPDGTWLETNRFEPASPTGGGSFGTSVELLSDTLIATDIVGIDHANLYQVAPDASETFTQTISRGRNVEGDGRDFLHADDITEIVTVRRLNADGSVGADTPLIATNRVFSALSGDNLGTSIDIRGDTAVSGAIFDSQITEKSGAVHVWQRVAGVWGQSTKILNPDGTGNNLFGDAVALGPGVLAVAVPRDDDMANDAGAVHIFRKLVGGWVHSQKLYSPNPEAGDQFGTSLDYDNGYLLTGDNDGSASFFLDTNPAESLHIAPIFDARADVLPGGNVVTDGEINIVVDESSDRRAIMEFDLSAIPDDAVVLSAKITFDVNLFTQTPGQPNGVNIHGYTGNGIAEPDDANQTGNLIGSSDGVNNTGPHDISLDPDYIQQLLGTGDTLGLIAIGQALQQFGFVTLEGTILGDAPRLSIEYNSYLPGDLNADGFIGIADLNIILNHWNQTTDASNWQADPTDDGYIGIEDLNLVLGNWNTGGPPISGGGVAIPEPATIFLAGALAGCYLRRAGRVEDIITSGM
ncbi:MAG: hypothetical protein R3C45_14930 [Phycisphaerales bacterium]